MDTNRKTAVIVGVFYLAATVAGILSKVFGPNLAAPDYLANLPANENKLIIQALLEFSMAILILGIAIWLYQVLKIQHKTLALGLVVTRTLEAGILTLGVI